MVLRRTCLSASAGLSCFLSSPTAKTAGRILSINTSNNAFSAKDMPFEGEKIKI